MASGNERLIEQFKEIRSSAKTHVSEMVNKLTELMTAYENIDTLKDMRRELRDVLKEFQIAHEAYHSLIKTKSDEHARTRTGWKCVLSGAPLPFLFRCISMK